MKKVLFFPQNDSHIPNMQPISEWLLNNGFGVTYIDASRIYHQKLSIANKYHTIIPLLSLEHSFYQLSSRKRLKYVYRFNKEISDSLISEYDILIIGNDGALQRVLINHFRKHNKKIVLLLDGVISDYSLSFRDIYHYSKTPIQDTLNLWKAKLKRLCIKQCARTSLSPYLPSFIGISPVSDIFVMGTHSKEVVQQVNSWANIYDWGLPRFQQHGENYSSIHSSNKVCYFPSAFKWHGLFAKDKAQHQDIELCCELIHNINQKSNCGLQFVIKMHPREKIEDYIFYAEYYDFVHIESELSVQDCFKTCSLFLSNLSTVIVEGLAIGVPVYSLMIHFDYWRYKNSFLGKECIQKIYDQQMLYDLLVEKTTFNIDTTLIDASSYFCNTQLSIDTLCREIIK